MKIKGVGTSTTHYIDRGHDRGLVRASYRLMRRSGLEPWQARRVIADLLFVGTSAGIGYAVLGQPRTDAP